MTSHEHQSLTLLRAEGADASISRGDLLARLEAARAAPAQPFAPDRVDLIARASERLLRREGRGVPAAIKHFAFFIRRGALQKLAANFEKRLPSQAIALPRGLVFHLPPQNVETVFLYSWVLSYLVGNANITRTPSAFGEVVRFVCNLFLELLSESGDETQFFVHYGSVSSLNAVISAASDARVVWGGDAKVAGLVPLPLRNGGKSIWFGDRSSFSVMRGDALRRLGQDERDAMARRMFNDIFVFDQMACSSPHVLFVVGDPIEDTAAVRDLLASVARVAQAAGQDAGTGHFMRKMVAAYQAAATGEASSLEWRNPALTSVLSASARRQEERVGGGFLWVDFIPSIEALGALARERDQTLTHFGFSPEEVSCMARAVARSGVSRLAPVGSALDFDSVWDGYDLPFELTRLVRVT